MATQGVDLKGSLPPATNNSLGTAAEKPIIHEHLANYIRAKANEKFDYKDCLRNRYFEYQTAQGFFNSIVKFLLGGGVGYFFVHKLANGSIDYPRLAAESQFHQLCRQVQQSYHKYKEISGDSRTSSNKRSQSLEKLQQAHKEVRGLVQDTALQATIDNILKRALGTDITKLFQQALHHRGFLSRITE